MNHTCANRQSTPFVTYAIIFWSCIMFVIQVWFGGSEYIGSLIVLGAKVNELIIYQHEWWRFVTPIFLHIGLPHLLFNMLVVYFLGSQIERIFGHVRFLWLYIGSGIMGNAFSFAFNPSVSAGASTAIFGLFVSTIVLAKLLPYAKELQHLAKQYRALIILNILFAFMASGVDNMGHIGGVVGGYFLAYWLSTRYTEYNPLHNRFTNMGLYILLITTLIIIGCTQAYYINF